MVEYSKDFREAKRSAEGSIIVSPAGSADRPDWECQFREQWKQHWQLARDCEGGTRTMRQAGKRLLPVMEKEEDAAWNTRKNRSVAFNALARTASGLSGMVFRKAIRYHDVPDEIRTDLEDVDLLGNAVDQVAQHAVRDALIVGKTWLLVDGPDEAPANREEEVTLGRRPRWSVIPVERVLNWAWSAGVGGRPELSLFVYREDKMMPSGAYGRVAVPHYRVLRPGSFELWREEEKGLRLVEEGEAGVNFIPAVPVYGKRIGPFQGIPPLLDLAHLQVAHYQRSSLFTLALDYAVPVPVFTGLQPAAVEWGAGRAIFLPDADATAQMLEATGQSWAACRDELRDLETQMAAQGLSMLQRETRAAETAEAKRIDSDESDAALMVVARDLEDSLNQALAFHAAFRGIDKPGFLEVSKDFRSHLLSPSMVNALMQAVSVQALSRESFWAALQAGEVLPDSFDPEVEQVRLDAGDIMG